jgi:2-dehydro-3-deoxy-phosphogluconate/2-dehydro-3-deoxy-6-phosphogalactonate aldolase
MQSIIVPILTPFTKDNRLDVNKFKNHAQKLVERGADALFIAGTNGLGPALSSEERKTLLKAAYDVTDKLILQVGGLNMEEVRALTKYAGEFHVKAVAALPPYFFPRLPERWIVRYFKEICAASVHPVYAYNYPLATGVDISVNVIREAACISGIKDTTTDLSHPLEYKRNIPSLSVYTGADTLVVASLAIGLDGVVSAAGNYALDVLVKIREMVQQGRVKEALPLQFRLTQLVLTAREFGQFAATYTITERLMGYDVGLPREPLFPLSEEEKARLYKRLEEVLRIA